MFSFTIAAIVLVTGTAMSPNSNHVVTANFKYVKDTLRFDTLEECEKVRYNARANLNIDLKASAIQGVTDITKCEEIK